MREYHPPDGGGTLAPDNRGRDRGKSYSQHPPNHYSGTEQPSAHSPRTVQSDHESVRPGAAYDSGHYRYKHMDHPPSSRENNVTPSKASAASYPVSEARSAMPPAAISPPPSEVDLSTSRRSLSVIPQPVSAAAEDLTFESYHGRRTYTDHRNPSLGRDGTSAERHSGSAGGTEATHSTPQLGDPRSVSDPFDQTAIPHSASAHDAPVQSIISGHAVPTWMRRHEPGSYMHGLRFSTVAYDANSVAVPTPRPWGGGVGDGQQLDRPLQADRRQSTLATQPAPTQCVECSSANVRRGDTLSDAPHSPQSYVETGHSAYRWHGSDHPSFNRDGYARDDSLSGEGTTHSPDQSRHVSPAHQTQGPPSAPAEGAQALCAVCHNPRQWPVEHQENVGPCAHNLNVAPATQLRSGSCQEQAVHPLGTAARLRYGDRPHLRARHDGEQVYGHQPSQSMTGRSQITEDHPTQSALQQPSCSDDQPGTPHRDSCPPRSVSHPPAKPTYAESTAAHNSIDQGWAPKPIAEVTSDATPWTSPNIHAWAHHVNSNQPGSTAPTLPADADDTSPPERPDTSCTVPQSLQPHTTTAGDDVRDSALPRGIAPPVTAHDEGAERGTVLLADQSASFATNCNESDDLDRPATPTDFAEGVSQFKRSRAEVDPNFWWEEPHPRDCPKFQSRRIIVTTPFPIRNDEFRGFLLQHFKRYGPVRCVSPFKPHGQGDQSDQSDKAAVVFHYEDSMVQLFNDDKRYEASFRSSATSHAVKIRLSIYRRPAEAEFFGFWIMFTGPRHDMRPGSESPTLPDQSGTVETPDKRTVPASLEVWAVPGPPRRGGKHSWLIMLRDPRDEKPSHGPYGDQGEPILLETIDLGRRTLDKEFLPRLVSYYCDIQQSIVPENPSQPWRFVVCRSWKLNNLISQLGRLPGFSLGRWYMNAQWRGNSPGPTLTSQDSDHGGEDPEEVIRGRSGLDPVDRQLPIESPSNLKHRVIPTYKGRQLRKTLWAGQLRFIDDAAVYITNLSHRETEGSLVERFSKYGEISGVEMELGRRRGRVMFTEKKAASDAIRFEDGQASLGSVIRVLDRQVPLQYVDQTHIVVDAQGHTVDPSEVYRQAPSAQNVPFTLPQNHQPADSGPSGKEKSETFNVPIPVSSTPTPDLREIFIVAVDYSTGAPKATVTVSRASVLTVMDADTPIASSDAKNAPSQAALSPRLQHSSVKSPPIDPNEPKPRVLSTSYDAAGLFRPTYDPEELKVWKNKNGISEVRTPPWESKPEVAKSETATLLPVSTGGHASVHGSCSAQMPQSAASCRSNVVDQHDGRTPTPRPPLDQHSNLLESSSRRESSRRASPGLYSPGRADEEALLRLSHPQPDPRRLSDYNNASSEGHDAAPDASRPNTVGHEHTQQSTGPGRRHHELTAQRSGGQHVQHARQAQRQRSDRSREQSDVYDHRQNTWRGEHHRDERGQRPESRYGEPIDPTRRTEVQDWSDLAHHGSYRQVQPARCDENERHIEIAQTTAVVSSQRDHGRHDSRQTCAMPQAGSPRYGDSCRQPSLASDHFEVPRQSRNQRHDDLGVDASHLDEAVSQHTERYNVYQMTSEPRPPPQLPRQWEESSRLTDKGTSRADRLDGSGRGSRPATAPKPTLELEHREERVPTLERPQQQPAAAHSQLAYPPQLEQARPSERSRQAHQSHLQEEEYQMLSVRGSPASGHEHVSGATEEDEDTGGW